MPLAAVAASARRIGLAWHRFRDDEAIRNGACPHIVGRKRHPFLTPVPLGRQIRKCSLWEALICRIVSAAVMGLIVIGCVTDLGWTASLRAVLFARLL